LADGGELQPASQLSWRHATDFEAAGRILLSGMLLSPMRPQTCPVQMAASTITCVVQTSYKVALGAVILPFMKRHFKVPPGSFQVLAGIPAAGFEENP